MEDSDRIKQMLKEGKINSDQADLLLRSLTESTKRKESIFQEVIVQKQKREQKVSGFLGIWILLILASISIFIFTGNSQRLGRDIHKALDNFNQAIPYLEEENYLEAIAY